MRSEHPGAGEDPGGNPATGLTGAWAWASRHPVFVDAAWVLPFALLCLVGLGVGSTNPVLLLIALVEVGALAVRRVAPVASVVMVFLAALAHWLVLDASAGYPLQIADLAVLMALYSTAAHGPWWARWTALAGGALGSFLLGSSAVFRQPALGVGVQALGVVMVTAAVAFVLCLLAWTGGQLRRVRLEQLAATAEAGRRARSEAEQRVLVAAGEERARIARELHDVVAHSLSVVIAQADGGRYAARSEPAAASAALETVAVTARVALTDMRQLLGVLREGGDGGETDAAHLGPQPGVGDIADLVASVCASGLRVALTQVGAPERMSAGAGLALYRGVQEALTNVLKHAGTGATARVQVTWRPERVEVRIEDGGGGAGPMVATTGDGLGRGLVGMRERMTLFGGCVDAGHFPGGGFGVRLWLPRPATAPALPTSTTPTQGTEDHR